MNGEALALEPLMHGPIERLLHPAEKRRWLAREVPLLIARQLSHPVSPEIREAWCSRFVEELWPAIQAERGHRWDLGWAELVAGIAASIELLVGELPGDLQRQLDDTPAKALWAQGRRRHERYMLLLDEKAHICRMFVFARELPSGVPVESGVTWRHDGPAFQGRSHTLLLALMAGGLLPDSLGPIAASGELDEDGRTVRPVRGLIEKAKAWWESFPNGMLISGPLDRMGDDDWRALGEDPWPQWISGGSLSELTAKLEAPPASPRRWDGTVLAPEHIAEAALDYIAEPPPGPLRDPLLGAAWAASLKGSEEGGRRGVLIEGVPGAGKSTLSRVLESRFRTSLWGNLGFVVRRSARELAEDLSRSSARTWFMVLAVREPERRALFEELDRTARLVPLVDGLDELSGVALKDVASLLGNSPGWWMATTRPMVSVLSRLPPVWRLQIRQPSSSEARRLLRGAGRGDLAERLFVGDDWRRPQVPASLVSLIQTPLHLTLLARVLRENESLEQLSDDRLYQRVFDGLIEQACQEQRLTEDDARRLRGLRGDVIGELALAWLRDPKGSLDGATVDLLLGEAGFKAAERPDLLRALEFGHLLAPAGDAWDFAHRTLAEWAAAEALHRQVSRRQREWERSSGASADPEARARIELECLAFFLGDDSPNWGQLLRFYAAHLREPLALLARLTQVRLPTWTPEMDSGTGRSSPVSEYLRTWDLAFDLLSRARWSRPREACLAWGMAARRWLLFEPHGDRFVPGERDLTLLKALAVAVSGLLPRTLPELQALVGRTEAQRTRLLDNPTLLLPAIPPSHASTLDGLLRDDSPTVRLAVLRWYADHGLEPDESLLDSMMLMLPAEIEAAEAEAPAGLAESQSQMSRKAHSEALGRLEALVWETSLRTRRALPRSKVHSRMRRWPENLEEIIIRWIGMPTGRDVSAEDGHQHRREVVAASLEEAVGLTASILKELKQLREAPEGAGLVGHLLESFSDSMKPQPGPLLRELLRGMEWTAPLEVSSGEGSQRLEAGLRRLMRIRNRLVETVNALDDTRLEPVLGGLWGLLHPEQPEREVLLRAIEEAQRPPPQVPARLLMERQGDDSWMLERFSWTPSHLPELRELSASGRGTLRFMAIRLLAKQERGDERQSLVQALPSADPELQEQIQRHLERETAGNEPLRVKSLPLDAAARLPLLQRVEHEVPGWKAGLLAELAGPDSYVEPLVRLAVRKGIHEALPLLAGRLEKKSWQDSGLTEAIALLCTASEADARWARVALRHALLHGWPDEPMDRRRARESTGRARAGEVLAGFLEVGDLELLSLGARSALPHPALAAAIRRLGARARERLMTLYRDANDAVLARMSHPGEDDSERVPTGSDRELAKRRNALAETLVVSFDPLCGGLKELVDLALQVVGGDVHHVYSMPGPLGSDFDGPGDLDWYSDQENAGLVKALGQELEAGLAREPGAWPELRRLFESPSETLRLRAFELCAGRAPSHLVAQLALDALDGFARANQTRWTGPSLAYRLSGGGGAGTSYVEVPETATRLTEAVRQRLTPAHRGVVEVLAAHGFPVFRALAARWSGQLGDESWVGILRPLLTDPVPFVVYNALYALALIAPRSLEDSLSQADRTVWTTSHDAMLFQWLRGDDRRQSASLLSKQDGPPPMEPLRYLSVGTVERLLIEAAERCTRPSEDEPRRTPPFDGFPSLIEEVFASLWRTTRPGPSSQEMLKNWTHHPVVSVRAIALRLRAAHDLLAAEEVLPLLSGVPIEQLRAAECLVRMDDESHAEAASAFWRSALGRDGALMGSRHRLDLYHERAEDRLMWALRGASHRFAPLLGLVAAHIPYDSAEGMDTPEGERLVHDTLQVVHRWGERGVRALLDLIEARHVEDHYDFMELVKRTARRSESFREYLGLLAKDRGGPAERAYTEVLVALEEDDLDGLAVRLAEEVFPEGWPT
ncbi:HEAT repeat domain-containing protein [Corallococcus sp. AB045]|uniref:HEAT repeat domain-containing protein n=1 Tax=Corallococcus sp. AB045 TaxID=2316719 RepID=UPI0011C46E6F|nr:HEAT repeat domain-containing protein [Corallococcus sp. AB045]